MRLTTGDNVMADLYQVYEAGAPTFLGYYELDHSSVPARDAGATIYQPWPARSVGVGVESGDGGVW